MRYLRLLRFLRLCGGLRLLMKAGLLAGGFSSFSRTPLGGHPPFFFRKKPTILTPKNWCLGRPVIPNLRGETPFVWLFSTAKASGVPCSTCSVTRLVCLKIRPSARQAVPGFLCFGPFTTPAAKTNAPFLPVACLRDVAFHRPNQRVENP